MEQDVETRFQVENRVQERSTLTPYKVMRCAGKVVVTGVFLLLSLIPNIGLYAFCSYFYSSLPVNTTPYGLRTETSMAG